MNAIEKNAAQTFQNLALLYPTAFVYYWQHPVTGSWMGATPERFANVKDNCLHTIALAGTSTADEGQEAVWTTKEIDEQQREPNEYAEVGHRRHPHHLDTLVCMYIYVLSLYVYMYICIYVYTYNDNTYIHICIIIICIYVLSLYVYICMIIICIHIIIFYIQYV